jgi:uncharacterized protein
MPLAHFKLDDAMARLGSAKTVAEPVSEPASMVRSLSVPGGNSTKLGVWECTPGRWVRQVKQAEFCHFLSGRAVFEPDDGSPGIQLGAGDVVFFPENSAGVWDIAETSRKIFIVFNERSDA